MVSNLFWQRKPATASPLKQTRKDIHCMSQTNSGVKETGGFCGLKLDLSEFLARELMWPRVFRPKWWPSWMTSQAPQQRNNPWCIPQLVEHIACFLQKVKSFQNIVTKRKPKGLSINPPCTPGGGCLYVRGLRHTLPCRFCLVPIRFFFYAVFLGEARAHGRVASTVSFPLMPCSLFKARKRQGSMQHELY